MRARLRGMKRLLFALLLFCAAASAQVNTTITATLIKGQDTQLLATGSLCVLGVDQNGLPIAYQAPSGGQVVNVEACTPVTNGAITPYNVANPALTSPVGIYYRIRILNASGNEVRRDPAVSMSGASFNYDLYVPPSTIQLPPNGGNIPGNFSFTGTVDCAGTCNGFGGIGSGISSLNSQAQTSQSFATGTGGSDFNISSALGVHTFNLPSANASQRGLLLSADWSIFNAKQAALGFTPLNPANNLSDVASASSSRTNLGLGTSATHASSDYLLAANNLSDVVAATARTNLGLGTAAQQNSSAFEVPLTFNAPLSRASNAISCSTCLTSAFYQTLQANAVDQTQRGKINFSTEFTLADNVGSNRTDVSVNSVAGSKVSGDISGNAANVNGTVVIAKGGTGQTSQTEGFDALSPNTTLGDLSYHNGTDNVRLAGNTSATRKFLRQTGNGSVSAAPLWDTFVAGDIPNITESQVTNLTTDLAAKVPTTRNVNTTAPIGGGGDLSADRTITISDCVASGGSHARGAVPDTGASAGTTKFLREDCTWQVPAGGSSVVPDPSVVKFEEDFLTQGANGTNSPGLIFDSSCDFGSCPATPTYANTVANHPGVVKHLAANTSVGNAAILRERGGFTAFPRLDNITGWELQWIFQLDHTGNQKTFIGFQNGVNCGATSDEIVVSYDTSASDTNFMYETRSASGTATRTSSGIAADTGWHRFKVRSAVSGTLLFSLDGGSETSITTTLPAVSLNLAATACNAGTPSAAAGLLEDYVGVKITVTR